jgi:hypothetical protein
MHLKKSFRYQLADLLRVPAQTYDVAGAGLDVSQEYQVQN